MIKASFYPPLSLLARSSLSLELEAVEGIDRWPRADLDARGHLRFPCGKVEVAVAKECHPPLKFLDPAS